MNRFGRALLGLLLGAAAIAPVRADGLILNDGRKLSGRVVQKPDGYEITVDGQTFGVPKEDVKLWAKSPKDVLGDADKLFDDAKKLYSEAVEIKDDKAAEAKFREALPKVQKARDAYAEARELFPDGELALDARLIDIMKMMRLVRERCGSQLASGTAPVKAKEEPPPKPKLEAKAEALKVVEPKPEPPPASTPADAWAILADPKRRADENQRAAARGAFRKGGGDLFAAAAMVLAKSDEEWRLATDIVTVKTASSETVHKGRLEKESDAVSWLVLPDRRRVRVRTESGGTFVTPPGGSETRAVDCKIVADAPGEGLELFQAFVTAAGPDKGVAAAAKTVAARLKEAKAKGAPVEAVELLVAGGLSAEVATSGGKASPDVEAVFKELGYLKSEFGPVWGRKEGLAMEDYRKWVASGEYALAIVQFVSEYKGLADAGPKYALGLLHVFRALDDNRNYEKAASYFERSAADVSAGSVKEHFGALGKSIRDASPCHVCGGTHKLTCSACKGKQKLNLECTGCGGSGSVNTTRGVGPCVPCKGKGRYINVDCPKCKASGKSDCKARGCKETAKPSFESFAEAFKCPSCRSRGMLFAHVAVPCTECLGIGLILQPKSDPSKLLAR